MRAVWYTQRGPAAEVLTVGEMPRPAPAEGEVLLRVAASGINVGDVKKRAPWLGDTAAAFPWIVPHSDGCGTVDAVGPGVDPAWVGRRVWCTYAQTYRPGGTAAEYTTVPVSCIAPLDDTVDDHQGACLGMAGITAHRALFADGSIAGATVLVSGALGAVGRCATVLAARAGASVIATVRREEDVAAARDLPAEVVVSGPDLAGRVRAAGAGRAVDRVVEVAFDKNIAALPELLAPGGVIATYAATEPEPGIPFWPLVFGNVVIRFVGYDDVPSEAVPPAMRDIARAAAAGDLRFPIGAVLPLERTAEGHRLIESDRPGGRVVVSLR